eukprot:CAMPEP_0118922904 /NCGR_PEP_ID=MMETSP1169-20130426/1652_1 /TAXON_ID=36882 /ORGANISM="Pyramimonas obovata, Strain CCMP722" /LENGTH=254 /DNA_ID=CAMNT_0006863833 /DNA_START=19 /DNA_END=780 /DNA_ORIENTATION=-
MATPLAVVMGLHGGGGGTVRSPSSSWSTCCSGLFLLLLLLGRFFWALLGADSERPSSSWYYHYWAMKVRRAVAALPLVVVSGIIMATPLAVVMVRCFRTHGRPGGRTVRRPSSWSWHWWSVLLGRFWALGPDSSAEEEEECPPSSCWYRSGVPFFAAPLPGAASWWRRPTSTTAAGSSSKKKKTLLAAEWARKKVRAVAVLLLVVLGMATPVTAGSIEAHSSYQACIASPSTCGILALNRYDLTSSIPTEIGLL